MGRQLGRAAAPNHYRGIAAPHTVKSMIITFWVSIKEIEEQGRDFRWPRPDSCPCCHGDRLWGHGFVWVYYDDFPGGIWLRRYRCPLCGAVHRLKPVGYFPRFQASISQIRETLSYRVRLGGWPPGVCRVRCGHWLKSLRRQVMAWFGQGYMGRLLSCFDRLILLGRIPVSRAI